MKKSGVLVFRIVFMLSILFGSLSFISALNGVGYCRGDACGCSWGLVQDLNELRGVSGNSYTYTQLAGGFGSCSSVYGLNCGGSGSQVANYLQCYNGQTVVCSLGGSYGGMLWSATGNPLGCAAPCTKSCLPAATTPCRTSTANGCASGCSATGGTYCASGSTCTSTGCISNTVVSKPYWADLQNGNILASADAGDTVLMKVPGQSLTGAVSYILYKQGGVSWNPLNWFTHQISQTSTLGIGSWVINDTGAFKFAANVSGIANTSDSLNVNTATSTSNSMPVAKMDYPNASRYIFAANTPISFNQSSYDADDLLTIGWNFNDLRYNAGYASYPAGSWTYVNGEWWYSFGGGWISIFASSMNYALAINASSGNVVHTFVNGGKWYKIILTAIEANRTQSATDSREIYVFKNGINVVPVITTSGNQDRITFDGSSSYVANCSASMTNPDFSAGGLNCKYINSGFELFANWTIDSQTNVYGNWSIASNKAFTKIFSSSGTYNAKLDLKYTSGSTTEESEKSVIFSTSVSGGWGCNATSTQAFWQMGTTLEDATTNCSKYSSLTGRNCCPTSNNICGADGKCKGYAQFCSEFNTSSGCNGASLDVAKASLPNSGSCGKSTVFTSGSKTCYNLTSCICSWEGNATSSNRCASALSYTKKCENQSALTYGECFFDLKKDDKCSTNENVIVLKASASWKTSTGAPIDAECKDYTKNLPCVSTVRLPFFGGFEFIAGICAVVFIYVIFSRKK